MRPFRILGSLAAEGLSALYVRAKRLKPLRTGPVVGNVFAARTGTVNFYIYKDSGCTLCFDTGFGRESILRQLRKLGVDPLSVTHVFLTHADFDHAGGVSLFKNAKVYISAEEDLMLSIRTVRMFGFYRSKKIPRQCSLLGDGDTVRAGNSEVRAVLTPGHTPGSMSYILNGSMLFSGDTLRLENGRVYTLMRYNMDTKTQEKSIRKLAALDIRYAFAGHSGFTDDFAAAVSEWKK